MYLSLIKYQYIRYKWLLLNRTIRYIIYTDIKYLSDGFRVTSKILVFLQYFTLTT